MSSIGSSLKQVPLNNGFFRSISSSITNDGSENMFSLTFVLGVPTVATPLVANPTNYNGLLRDMGAQYVFGGNTYRRVQVVPAGVDVGGPATGAADGDYGVYYIKVGRTGSSPSVFVRTG